MQGSKIIPQINGLRTLAIFIVVMHHLPLHIRVLEVSTTFGVNLFFILSGMVLSKPFIEADQFILSRQEILRFYQKRAARLYPLLLVNCVLSWLFFRPYTFDTALSGLRTLTTFSLFYGDDFMPAINFVLWSVMLEIWFSILLPLLLYAWSKLGLNKLAWGIVFFALMARIAGSSLPPPYTHSLELPGRLDDFFIGFVLMYMLHQNLNMVPWLRKNTTIILLFILCNAALYLLLPLKDAMMITKFTAYQTLLAPLIYVSIKYRSLLAYFLSQKWVQYPGIICYSIYVWHVLLRDLVFEKYGESLPGFTLYFISLGIAAWVSYQLFEKYLYAFLRRNILK